MRHDNKDNTLTIYLEGQVNSYNADNIEKEMDGIFSNEKFEKVVLDFANVSYISSAGLRIVLKLKQKYNDVTVINTSLEVYDIFSMTGFTNIMEVKKALRRVYISGAEIIGSGYYSTVYRINKDTIIKVFNQTDNIEQIEKELKLAKEAFVLGIPTAISFDIVQVDDKLGVCFEMLDCDSLRNIIAKKPSDIGAYADKYAQLLKKINTTECVSPNIPHIKDEYYKKLDYIKDELPKDLFDKATKLIDSIPERNTFVHGDCHFKNIMVQGDDLVLIDMETLSIGHPIFELAALYTAYVGLNEYNPDECMEFFGITSDKAHEIFDSLMNKYFTNYNEEIKEKIALVSYINVFRWYFKHKPDSISTAKCKERLFELINKYNDVDIGL